MSIKNTKGDLLTSDCVIRCHQVNCRGVMGAGIAKQIKAKYPEVFEPYQRLCKLFGSSLLGEVQYIACQDGTIIANLFAQDDYGTDKVQTDILALEECLSKVSIFAVKTHASVGFPKLMGAGLAGGDWTKIRGLIDSYFRTDSFNCTIVEWDPQTESEEPKEEKSKVKQKPKVTLYTDGSCLGNPGRGGWACIMIDDKYLQEKEMHGGCIDTTNNRMEITAVVEGLKALKKPCQVTLYTDSAYVVNSVTKGWLEGWKKNGWKKKGDPLKNIDLWKELDELLNIHQVTFIWVKGHAENEYNNRCDELARGEARRQY